MIEQKYVHSEIKWYTRLNPVWWFKNIDDPIVPPQFMGDKHDWPAWKLKLWWFKRNPMHNFMFYTVGIAGRDILRFGQYPNQRFATLGGWKFSLVIWKSFPIPLPFVSHDGRIRFYAGWTESGNLGFELKVRS